MILFSIVHDSYSVAHSLYLCSSCTRFFRNGSTVSRHGSAVCMHSLCTASLKSRDVSLLVIEALRKNRVWTKIVISLTGIVLNSIEPNQFYSSRSSNSIAALSISYSHLQSPPHLDPFLCIIKLKIQILNFRLLAIFGE